MVSCCSNGLSDSASGKVTLTLLLWNWTTHIWSGDVVVLPDMLQCPPHLQTFILETQSIPMILPGTYIFCVTEQGLCHGPSSGPLLLSLLSMTSPGSTYMNDRLYASWCLSQLESSQHVKVKEACLNLGRSLVCSNSTMFKMKCQNNVWVTDLRRLMRWFVKAKIAFIVSIC